MNLYLDIETIPDQRPGAMDRVIADLKPPGNIKKAESIDKWWQTKSQEVADEAWRKTALDGGRGHVWCICWAIEANHVRVVSQQDQGSERGVLTAFNAALNDVPIEHVIGHNLRRFDLRFLFHRSAILRTPLPLDVVEAVGERYSTRVIDTMEMWSGGGAHDYVSLDALADMFGIEMKAEIDGSKVWDAIRDGKPELVIEHCTEDVEVTRAVHQRMVQAMAGKFPAEVDVTDAPF